VQIRNPFLLNDWEISNTLKVVLLLQAAVLVISFFANFGLFIPIVQVPIAFIYLTFIPGILLLRILRVHNVGNVRTLLYSMGLSLSVLMTVGFVLNTIFPVIGVAHPISFINLAVALTLLVLALCIFSYLRDKEFANPIYVKIGFDTLSPGILALCLLPFLTIFATFLMNYYGSNWLQMVLLAIIMAIPFVVALGWMPKENYAFSLFVTSFSLLFHTALISSSIWGTDVNVEYLLTRLTVQNGLWDSTIPINTNGMLSIVMLAPIYSFFLNISLPWVFKTVYPLIFSFVPLGLFTIYKKQLSDKIAFFSCYLFVTFAAFYVEMPALARQSVAEVFLVLIVLLIVEDQRLIKDRTPLLIVFGAALAVSHYGTSYFFLIILALALPIAYIALPRVSKATKTSSVRRKNNIKGVALFFAIFAISWYLFATSSSTFNKGVRVADNIVGNIGEMFNPAVSQPLGVVTRQFAFLQTIERDILLLAFLFIAVGLIATLLDRKETKFTDEFTGFSCGAFLFLIGATILPFVASQLNNDRIISLTLLFLAPFCIIGLMRLLMLFGNSVKTLTKRLAAPKSKRTGACLVVSIFLLVWILFNSAFIYELFDQPKVGTFALDTNVEFYRLNDKELANAAWLQNYRQNNSTVFADNYKAVSVSGVLDYIFLYHDVRAITSSNITAQDLDHSYIFLGSHNVATNEILVASPAHYVPISEISQISKASVIFDNGGSKALFTN